MSEVPENDSAADSAAAPGGSGAEDSDADKREVERRRLIDLTRREKGLPERRNLGTDRRAVQPDDFDQAT